MGLIKFYECQGVAVNISSDFCIDSNDSLNALNLLLW